MRSLVVVPVAGVVIALACACVKNDAQNGEPSGESSGASDEAATTEETAGGGAPEKPAGPSDASAVDCSAMTAGLDGAVRHAWVAMSPQGPFAEAVQAWAEVEPACRDARWHLLGAKLLRTGLAEGDRLEAGDETFTSAREMLARGLALDPPSAELLVYASFLAAVGSADAPQLPDDMCERAERAPATDPREYVASDRVAYVCGHAALRAGEPRRAVERFARIRDRRAYLDLPLRHAEALGRADDAAGARKMAAEAVDVPDPAARAFGATGGERRALIDAAKKLQ